MSRYIVDRCSFGLHKWTKWKTDQNSELVRVYASGAKGKVGFFQDRECPNCGLAERRRVYST